MIIDVLTLFPCIFRNILETSMIRKAIELQALEVYITDIRDFAFNKHRQTDDYPYGGFSGMIMKPEPIYESLRFIQAESSTPVIYFTPQGIPLQQDQIIQLRKNERIVLLCGHYKEIDQRIRDRFVTHEISIGDYVLSGGEIPAMALIDGVARLMDGVLNDPESANTDSFSNGLLDCPYYTRPELFLGDRVPEVLLSGDHRKINAWKEQKSLEQTRKRRPDLLDDKK